MCSVATNRDPYLLVIPIKALTRVTNFIIAVNYSQYQVELVSIILRWSGLSIAFWNLKSVGFLQLSDL